MSIERHAGEPQAPFVSIFPMYSALRAIQRTTRDGVVELPGGSRVEIRTAPMLTRGLPMAMILERDPEGKPSNSWLLHQEGVMKLSSAWTKRHPEVIDVITSATGGLTTDDIENLVKASITTDTEETRLIQNRFTDMDRLDVESLKLLVASLVTHVGIDGYSTEGFSKKLYDPQKFRTGIEFLTKKRTIDKYDAGGVYTGISEAIEPTVLYFGDQSKQDTPVAVINIPARDKDGKKIYESYHLLGSGELRVYTGDRPNIKNNAEDPRTQMYEFNDDVLSLVNAQIEEGNQMQFGFNTPSVGQQEFAAHVLDQIVERKKISQEIAALIENSYRAVPRARAFKKINSRTGATYLLTIPSSGSDGWTSLFANIGDDRTYWAVENIDPGTNTRNVTHFLLLEDGMDGMSRTEGAVELPENPDDAHKRNLQITRNKNIWLTSTQWPLSPLHLKKQGSSPSVVDLREMKTKLEEEIAAAA